MHDGGIAIVNNDPALLVLLKELMTEEGYKVTTYVADSTTHAHIRATQPCLVVLDAGLQQSGSGWTVLKMLQFDPTTQHISVLVTSVDHRFIQEKAASLQAIGYDVLELPASIEVLLTKVEQLLGGINAQETN